LRRDTYPDRVWVSCASWAADEGSVLPWSGAIATLRASIPDWIWAATAFAWLAIDDFVTSAVGSNGRPQAGHGDIGAGARERHRQQLLSWAVAAAEIRERYQLAAASEEAAARARSGPRARPGSATGRRELVGDVPIGRLGVLAGEDTRTPRIADRERGGCGVFGRAVKA
jgi:hypothetical protein